jgi:cytochrome c oxidase assembly protein subunit 15
MPRTISYTSSSGRALRLWLLAVAGLIFAMVLVGGATRLTESGLSIVEWKPLTGMVPPLSEIAWQTEFEKYQTIPQYQQVNRGMTLDEFKLIYWWEWAHRLLGRLIGAAFLLPFLWFLWRGAVEPALRGWLWAIFGLGALQGAVGWWMVASGLAERVNVSPYRLAFHLTLACAIFALIIWTIQRLRPQPLANAPMRLRATAIVLLALVLGQIYWGALVAGLRAGLLYNTWPLIDGHVVPAAASLFFNEPWWRNLFENPLTVQFTHRMIAYALWVAAIVHAIDSARAGRAGLSIVLALAVTLQAALGIATLLYQVPISLALAHQGMAIIALAIAVVHAERLAPRRSVALAGEPIASAT